MTGYPFNDTNNDWIVEPTKEIPATGRGRVVRHKDVIKLRHVVTNTTLLTHDVACPTLATNTEFTTWDGQCATEQECLVKELDTHFELKIDDAHDGQQWMTKSGHFQLIHVPTRVAMWTHTDPVLPEWGHKQQEVNGNKNLQDKTTMWIADDIIRDPSASDPPFFSAQRLLLSIVPLNMTWCVGSQASPTSYVRRRRRASPSR